MSEKAQAIYVEAKLAEERAAQALAATRAQLDKALAAYRAASSAYTDAAAVSTMAYEAYLDAAAADTDALVDKQRGGSADGVLAQAESLTL